jgi:ABC-type nitrate/sulfonate/bicarbonate transport system permease component
MKALGKYGWVLPIITLLVGWELLARSGMFTPFLLPRCSLVIQRIATDLMSGYLLNEALLTLSRATSGFAIAAILGVSIGIAMAEWRFARWLFEPIVAVGFPTPKIAFMPIFMLWLGLGDTSKIALVTLACFFIIVTNSYAGAAGVDKHMLWAARSLGSTRRRILTQIILPAATPQILTGLQIALPMAVIIALAGEMIMGGGGIGSQLLVATRFADSVGLFAGIVEIAILGTILIRSLAYLRRRLLVWHSETQAVTT